MSQMQPPGQLNLHRDSHLASSESEVPITEFELALHHLSAAFSHWSVELNTYVGGTTLPVQDVSVLQVVRMRDYPKSAAEVGKYLNRDDAANILYSLRKLERCGLIEKVGNAPRQIAYEITSHGREVTDRYAASRRDILLNLIGSLSEPTELLESLAERMWLLAGLYEQAARKVSVMSFLPSNENVRPVRASPTVDVSDKGRREARAEARATVSRNSRRGVRKVSRV